MENEELLSGDQTSQEETRLNQEISREEGTGSWDALEIEPEENADGEIESGQDEPEEIAPIEIEVITQYDEDTEDNQEFTALDMVDGISMGADSNGEDGEPGESGTDGQEEEEETDQKNTLSDKSPRVLSFKDFFSKN